jgi:8-oxo-dGTP diphosphatase
MPQRSFTYDQPRPALAADVALFTTADGPDGRRLRVLLVRRKAAPYGGMWALPGGFVGENEGLVSAAGRTLTEETGVSGVVLEQVITVGRPGRDPRGHVVTVAWMGLVPEQSAASADVAWFDATGPDLPPLAFDHATLMGYAVDHLRRRIREAPLAFRLLPERFTLTELQAVFEAVLGRALDRRNFRRRVDQIGLVEEVPGERRVGAHRPARLFRLVPEAFDRHVSQERLLPF